MVSGMKIKARRFIVLDEIDNVICSLTGTNGQRLRALDFATAKVANEWASGCLGNWSVIEQVQYEDDWKWYSTKLNGER